MKEWKKAKLEAEGRLPKVKKTPNQILRELGFDNDFFNRAASWGLRVREVKSVNGHAVKVHFVGVSGNSAHTVQEIPLPTAGQPVNPKQCPLFLAHKDLLGKNPAVKIFTGPSRSTESQQADIA